VGVEGFSILKKALEEGITLAHTEEEGDYKLKMPVIS